MRRQAASRWRRIASGLLGLTLVAGCAAPQPGPLTPPPPALTAAVRPVTTPPTGRFDPDTEALIAQAKRVAFLVPFSHWDTDWHDDFVAYGRRADANIAAALDYAAEHPHFRYALEQVAFVQRFWDTHPERRDQLRTMIDQGRFTFAWAGMTQPETSLTAPAIQMRNLALGQAWITATFGPEAVPHTAWQSDAFGNSAALPGMLQQVGVPYLFIGRWQHRCDPEFQDCQPLPLHFYWRSPAAEARVLTAYIAYADAWGSIFRAGDEEAAQVAALQAYVDEQFARTSGRYALIPMGFDFLSPLPQLMRLVDANNAASDTVFVVSDPQTAFDYVASEPQPEFTVDLNPIWQAFYGSRPEAKIADKESEFYLTANAKFGGDSTAWYTATFNAHYDNIAAVSFDDVWFGSQQPRFRQTLATAAADLAATLARLHAGAGQPTLVVNPTSWPRREVIELADASWAQALPHQALAPGGAAVLVSEVPAIGWAPLAGISPVTPVRVAQADAGVTLANGRVAVTLDPHQGGVMTWLGREGGASVLRGPGDDVIYWTDTGDVYGAFFGEIVAQASRTPATMTVVERGPLLAQVQITQLLAGQPLTRTVTLRAESDQVEVALTIRALPETSAIAHSDLALDTALRTDDLGFGALTHAFDRTPISPGDITYRRRIFYPSVYWTDRATESAGLGLITHGLQGVSGVDSLGLLLVRAVTDIESGEGLTDPDWHTLHYAYVPHSGRATELWRAAYAFNQPLLVAGAADGQTVVQVPFQADLFRLDPPIAAPAQQSVTSLLGAEGGLVADVMPTAQGPLALVLSYSPATPVTVHQGDRIWQVTGPFPRWVPIDRP